MVNKEAYQSLIKELDSTGTTLVAVSKTKPEEDILELYNLGQRDFGENYVQELLDKKGILPLDIKWHFIGHLQSNKVKQIVPFVHLIHGVDSYKLLEEINKQAIKVGRVVDCLLQVHIAEEDTKFGFDEKELSHLFEEKLNELNNIRIIGLMGMSTLTDDIDKVRYEFAKLKRLFDKYSSFKAINFKLSVISMGMSGDYQLAIEEGSTMVRIGSLLFGKRV